MLLTVFFTVYRTFPLNDPRLGSKKMHHLPIPHPSSETLSSSRLRSSDTDIALQNLAKLNVSNKGVFDLHIVLVHAHVFTCMFGLVAAPENWSKGKLLGSGAFGQVHTLHFPHVCEITCILLGSVFSPCVCILQGLVLSCV